MIDPMWVFSGLFTIYLCVAIHGAFLNRRRAKMESEFYLAVIRKDGAK